MKSIIYLIGYIFMLVGFATVSAQSPTFKLKIIGALLLLVNGLLYWKW